MPSGYSAANIARIVPSFGAIKLAKSASTEEKPFVTCYVDGL